MPARDPHRPGLVGLLSVVGWVLVFSWHTVLAVPIEQDPKSFNGIGWGTPFSESAVYAKVDESGKIRTYERTDGRPFLGPVRVESMKFVTIEGQFARVIVRYLGKSTHEQVLTHLQSLYGPIDRTPGAMTRGSGQQFNWRGTDTEVNLTYETVREVGFLFIDSAVLAPRFNDSLPEHAY